MATLKYLPQYFSTTLNVGGGIDASQTTGIVLQSVSGVDITKPGQICISYSDPIDTGVAEWIDYTSINGSNALVGAVRGREGYSAHTHLPGATIQFTLSATHINDLNDVVNGIKGKELTTTAGGTTTYTLTPATAVAAYVTGAEFQIKMNASNTGASTINISGLGAKSLTKGGATALASGDMLIDGIYKITYDGTQFQVSGIGSATVAATRAEVATGTSNTLMNTPLNTYGFRVPPQGFLYNGKIVPSVASNNLTVALKGLDGNDASASNPIYVRIGDAVRTISAALSVTKNAATNWFNAGAAELATLEIDYFVYLGYNATDGVTIGFARIPNGRTYGDFSATTTNAKYCAISTITTAASTDQYENIGRFNAILSATASFNWSLPGTSVIINQPIRETRWLSFAPVWTGFSANPTYSTKIYKIFDDRCHTKLRSPSAGTSNATGLTMVGPFPALTSSGVYAETFVSLQNNSVNTTTLGVGLTAAASSTFTFYIDAADNVWTASGGKCLNSFDTIYQI